MKKIIPIIIVSVFCVVVGLFISRIDIVQNIDNLIVDANIRYFSPETKASDKIVIIFLDETTMKDLPYRSPVPRDFLFKLNEKILAAGPRAVGYDIFFKDTTIP